MSLDRSPKEVTSRFVRKARFGVDKFILVQRYKIHYVEAGAGEPVILIPGSYSTYRAWSRLLSLLAVEFRILELDYTGTGEGEKPGKVFDQAIREQTDLIARLVQQMGLDKVSLIGGSFDGEIVFDFAARYPDLVNKIISIEGSVVKAEKIKGDPAEYRLKVPVIGDLSIRIVRPGPQNKTAAKTAAGKWYCDLTAEDKLGALGQISPGPDSPSRVPWYKINIGRNATSNFEEEAKSIKSPVLYLYGTKFDYKKILLERNLEYLKSFLPHAWVVALEGGINDLAMQKPEEVAGLILEYLRKKPALRS